MSYWPGDCPRYPDPSPLPSQDNNSSSQSLNQSSTVPPSTVIPPPIPPLPPRPLGFGHQPVGQSISPSWESVYGSTNTVGGGDYGANPSSINSSQCNAYNQYSTATPLGAFSAQTRGYTDVTNFPLGAKMHSPPPSSPLSPRYGETTTSPRIFPAASSPGVFANHLPTGVYLGEQGEAHATRDVSASRHFGPRQDGAQSHAPGTASRNAVDENISVGGSSPSIANDKRIRLKDMAAMHQTFQTMRLANPNEATLVNSGSRGTNQYPAYFSQSVSPPPATTAHDHAPSLAHSLYVQSTPRPKRRGPKECISTNVTFAAIWYAHPRTPEYQICANCYDNYIRHSRFAADFGGELRDDGNPRRCRFSSPRMKDSLFESALVSGSLDKAVQYMSLRASISDCVGQIGVKGEEGIKWYRTRNMAIPTMAVCQACYEDEILAYEKFGGEHFEPNAIRHPPDQIWTCDMAIPYVARGYRLRAETDNWESFVQEVPARINMRHCPGEEAVYPSGKWFTPVEGPLGFLICLTCYCDYFLLTGQEKRWKDAENLVNIFGASVSCCLGPFNMKALAARIIDTSDWGLFWKAVDIIGREPTCKPNMQNATWFTLHSNPTGFAICRTCYATIAEPLGVGKYFMLKPGVPPGATITCSFNPAVPRFPLLVSKLLQMVYKQEPAALEEFVKTYAFMPLCPRDTHVENGRWYGWNECFVCPECHHEFVRGTTLADMMPHRGIRVEGGVMCELYSPHMRDLYLAACASDPPDLTPLLDYSMQRRAGLVEAIPRTRQIASEMMFDMEKQQKMATSMSNAMLFGFMVNHDDMNNTNSWQNSHGNNSHTNNALPLQQSYGEISAVGQDYHDLDHMYSKGDDAEYGH